MAFVVTHRAERLWFYAPYNTPQAIDGLGGSFTPSNNSLLVCTIHALCATTGDGRPAFTITDSLGGTWTPQVDETNYPTDYGTNIFIFTRPVTTGASMTVYFELDSGGFQADGTSNGAHVTEITGHDTVGSWLGLTETYSSASSTAVSMPLNGTTAANSLTFAAGDFDGNYGSSLVNAVSPYTNAFATYGGPSAGNEWHRHTGIYATGAQTTAEFSGSGDTYTNVYAAMEVKGASSSKVQSVATVGNNSSGTSVSVTIAGVGTGNAICGIVAFESGTLTSVTDNQSNTYNLETATYNPDDNNYYCAFSRTNITNAPTVITANFGSSTAYRFIGIDEFTGISTASSDERNGHAVNAQSGAGTATDAITSGNITTTVNRALIYGAGGSKTWNGISLDAGTGFTQSHDVQQGGDGGFYTEYKTQLSAGSVAATWTASATGDTVAFVIALKPAANQYGNLTAAGLTNSAPVLGAPVITRPLSHTIYERTVPAAGDRATSSSNSISVAAGDLIVVNYCTPIGTAMQPEFDNTSISKSGTAISWSYGGNVGGGDGAMTSITMWYGVSTATESCTFTITHNVGGDELLVRVFVIKGQHATTPVPAGKIVTDNVNGTSVSFSMTPTDANGSELWLAAGDWNAYNTFSAGANCSIEGTPYHNVLLQTSALVRPTTQPRPDGSAFTLSISSSTSDRVQGIGWEVVAAPQTYIQTLTASNLVNAAPTLGAPALATPLIRTHIGGYAAATTDSFTPPNNSLLVVVGVDLNSGTIPAHSISGGGLAWTDRITLADYQDGGSSGYYLRTVISTAPVTTGASMTVTINGGYIDVYAFQNYDTSSPTGVTATENDYTLTGAQSITLSGAPAASSEVLAGRSRVDWAAYDTTATPGTGWTETLDYVAGGGWHDVQVQVRGGSTSTDVSWLDVDDTPGSDSLAQHLWAIEIKGLGGAPDTVDDLTASNLANIAPTLGPATLAQIHALIASPLSNITPTLGAPALGIPSADSLYLFDYQMDFGLNAFTLADKIVVCSQRPMNFTEANVTYKIGEKSFGVGNVVTAGPQNATPTGRQIITAAVANGTVTTNGTPTKWAIIDSANSRLLAAGDMTGSEAVTTADGWTLEAMTINVP
jgi:hypothetical protein